MEVASRLALSFSHAYVTCRTRGDSAKLLLPVEREVTPMLLLPVEQGATGAALLFIY